eukprot:286567_1
MSQKRDLADPHLIESPSKRRKLNRNEYTNTLKNCNPIIKQLFTDLNDKHEFNKMYKSCTEFFNSSSGGQYNIYSTDIIQIISIYSTGTIKNCTSCNTELLRLNNIDGHNTSCKICGMFKCSNCGIHTLECTVCNNPIQCDENRICVQCKHNICSNCSWFCETCDESICNNCEICKQCDCHKMQNCDAHLLGRCCHCGFLLCKYGGQKCNCCDEAYCYDAGALRKDHYCYSKHIKEYLFECNECGIEYHFDTLQYRDENTMYDCYGDQLKLCQLCDKHWVCIKCNSFQMEDNDKVYCSACNNDPDTYIVNQYDTCINQQNDDYMDDD